MSEPRTWILSEHNDGAWRVNEDASHSTLSIDERVPVVELSALEAERAARDAAEREADRLNKAHVQAVAARDAAEAKAAAITEDRRKAVHWMEREREDARAERDRLAAALRGIARHAASVGPGFPCSALAEAIESEALAALSVLDRMVRLDA